MNWTSKENTSTRSSGIPETLNKSCWNLVQFFFFFFFLSVYCFFRDIMVWKRGCCSSQCYSLKTNSQSSGWASRHSRSSSGTPLPRSNWSQARAPTGNLLLINPFPSPSAETSDPICRKKKTVEKNQAEHSIFLSTSSLFSVDPVNQWD